jgi:hypothetical protein
VTLPQGSHCPSSNHAPISGYATFGSAEPVGGLSTGNTDRRGDVDHIAMEPSKRRRFHLHQLVDTIRRWQVGLTLMRAVARQVKLTALRRLSTLR